MNLRKLIVVALSAIVALSGNAFYSEVARAQPGNNRRTFADWCRQKADLSPETKHTVDVLLKEAETTDCDVGDRKLSSLTELDLSYNQISDIKPLASLTNLTFLDLSADQISDIKPLASLTNLTTLYLGGNQISYIKPLASLTNLTLLNLMGNEISDIKPLASLTNLTALWLGGNEISDIKPLASLTKLLSLSLGGNPIAPKTCPLKPESICKWQP
jgi:hypothetical protein